MAIFCLMNIFMVMVSTATLNTCSVYILFVNGLPSFPCFYFYFQQNIREYFNKQSNFSSLMWSTAVAIFAVGGMFGALFGPAIADSLGR